MTMDGFDPLSGIDLAALEARKSAAEEFPLLSSLNELPTIRHRLHAICALYAHTPSPLRRLELLDHLERLAFQVSQVLAVEMLEAGWRPDTAQTKTPPPGGEGVLFPSSTDL